jgi:predicted MPP superfamily phosphohydrolase
MFPMILVAFLGANVYVFYRLWAMIPAGPLFRPLLLVLAVVLVGSAFLGLRFGDRLPLPVVRIAYTLGTAWFFILICFTAVFLLLDLLRLTRLLPFLNVWMFGHWVGLAAVVGIVALVMTVGHIRYRDKARIDLPVATEKREPGAEPLKIVALSDLHLGYTIGKRELEGWIDRINREKPDAVLLVGDVVDNNPRPLVAGGLAAAFHKIESRYGVFAVPGNHEYITGIDESLAFLRQGGVTVLRDSAVLIGGSLWVAGRDDRSNRRRLPLEKLMESLDRSKPVIVLDHQPVHLEEAERNGVDLQLSGHTHRGQVWPIRWIVEGMFEKAYGSLKKGNTNYYITSGMGIWGGKFRIGTRSEYVVITLSGK